jgi:MoaA/NifB/PqqE/SkfB family radical SAM enzyme
MPPERNEWKSLGKVPPLLKLRRLANAALVKLQARLRCGFVPGLPRYVGIELANRCTGGCVLCPIGQSRQGRPQGQMEYADFCRITDQIAWHADSFSLYKWGDPFHHRRALDMVRYAKGRRIYCRISSNLHLLDPADAQPLVETGLDELTASLHGMTEATYNLYQPGHHLHAAMATLQAVLDAKQRLRSPTPLVRIAFVVRKDNEHELPELERFARDHGVGLNRIELSLNLRFLPYDSQGRPRGLSDEELAKERLELMDRWLPRDPAWVNAGYKTLRASAGRLPDPSQKLARCLTPWQCLFISWNGDVDACAGGFAPEDSLGNVFRQSIREIWRGPLFRAARRAAAGRCRAGDPRTLCQECPGTLL